MPSDSNLYNSTPSCMDPYASMMCLESLYFVMQEHFNFQSFDISNSLLPLCIVVAIFILQVCLEPYTSKDRVLPSRPC